MNKKKKIANLHTNMAILTNIKLDYSSAGLAKVASTLLPPECVVYCQKEMGVIVNDCSLIWGADCFITATLGHLQ